MPPTPPHLVLIGGFLGAGKTTALIAMAEWLANQGIRAGFVTNDQGTELVDTRLLEYCGMATEEIAGGCFCCRFNELVDATGRLRALLRPDVLVAEAVGSCTDLAATVANPIRRLLGDACTVAPLSVLVDPDRAARALGLDDGAQFSDNVQYIYRKQLEEADVIVITKSDLVDATRMSALERELRRQFPHAALFVASSTLGTGLDQWFRHLLFAQPQSRPTMTIDYDRYADGESRLGWLNATINARSAEPADGNALIDRVVAELRRQLAGAAAIAHLKMTLQSGNEMASANLVRDDAAAKPAMRMEHPITAATLTINLRAEAAPEVLERALHAVVTASPPWQLTVASVESFRPGRPEPTHRDVITPSST